MDQSNEVGGAQGGNVDGGFLSHKTSRRNVLKMFGVGAGAAVVATVFPPFAKEAWGQNEVGEKRQWSEVVAVTNKYLLSRDQMMFALGPTFVQESGSMWGVGVAELDNEIAKDVLLGRVNEKNAQEMYESIDRRVGNPAVGYFHGLDEIRNRWLEMKLVPVPEIVELEYDFADSAKRVSDLIPLPFKVRGKPKLNNGAGGVFDARGVIVISDESRDIANYVKERGPKEMAGAEAFEIASLGLIAHEAMHGLDIVANKQLLVYLDKNNPELLKRLIDLRHNAIDFKHIVRLLVESKADQKDPNLLYSVFYRYSLDDSNEVDRTSNGYGLNVLRSFCKDKRFFIGKYLNESLPEQGFAVEEVKSGKVSAEFRDDSIGNLVKSILEDEVTKTALEKRLSNVKSQKVTRDEFVDIAGDLALYAIVSGNYSGAIDIELAKDAGAVWRRVTTECLADIGAVIVLMADGKEVNHNLQKALRENPAVKYIQEMTRALGKELKVN